MARVEEFSPQLDLTIDRMSVGGGRVQAIAVNPIDANEIIAAHQWGGLWRSDDGGSTWSQLSDLRSLFVIDVAFAPDGERVIATLARDNRRDNGGGIWVSDDHGSSWSKPAGADPPIGADPAADARVPSRMDAHGVSFAPDDPTRVYVGTDYGIAASATGGDNWHHKMLEMTSPVNEQRTQNAVLAVAGLPGNAALALSSTGVYLTTHQGWPPRWRQVRAGPFAFGVKCLAVSPRDSDTLFIQQDYSRLYIYEREAAVWTALEMPRLGESRGPFVRVTSSPAGPEAFDVWVGVGRYLLRASCADIADARRLTPASWATLGRGAGIHEDCGDLGVSSDGRPILFGSDGGLFRPDNADASRWRRAQLRNGHNGGLNSYQITSLAGTNVRRSDGGDARFLYFATQDNGLWGSADGGRSWPANDCMEGFHVQVRPDASSQAQVRVAYGKVECGGGNWFADANFARPRRVPDISDSGIAVAGLEQAFFVAPERWMRQRAKDSPAPEIWVSDDNGERWRRRVTLALAGEGVPQAGQAADGTYVGYGPYRGERRRASDGAKRIGLMRFDNLFGQGERVSGERDLMYLPDEGGLGIRATEFDWQAVYGINPHDPFHVIAPDILNGVVRVSRTGGTSWANDRGLTNLVTAGGELLLYDGDEWHVQVTKIAFDPYDRNRIFVGTRDAGVIVSDDRGNSWRQIDDSQRILYATGFFFGSDYTTVVSTYGRGLWKIDFRFYVEPFPEQYLCREPCIIRWPPDPAILTETVDWKTKDATVFLEGRVNGLVVAGDTVKRVTVTPGTRWRRYAPLGGEPSHFEIIESMEGEGFDDLKGCLSAVENGEAIKAVALEEARVVAIVSGKREWTADDFPPQDTVPAQLSEAVPSDGAVLNDESAAPYAILTTNLGVTGLPVLGQDNVLHVTLRGLKAHAQVAAVIDGSPTGDDWAASEEGTVTGKLVLSDDLAEGRHSFGLAEPEDLQAPPIAEASFVKAVFDAGDD